MWQYIGKKIIQSSFVLLICSLLCFIVMRLLPGSIAYSVYGANAQRLTPTEIERLEATLLGKDTLFAQYVTWLQNMLQGQWGYSISQQQAVSQLILELAMPTTIIVVVTIFLTNIFVTCFVLFLHLTRSKVMRTVAEGLLFGATIVPGFWLCFLFLWFFAVELHWFPLYGIGNGSFLSMLYYTFLPSVTLSVPTVFYGVKLIQENLVVVQKLPFLTQLQKRGISRWRYLQHIFPHIALIYLQLNGYLVAAIVGGTIAVETVFSLPGLGRLTIEATKTHDYPVLMMILMAGLALIVVVQLVIDVLSGMIDPRVYKSLKE